MNIRYLDELLSRTEEITVIGKNAEIKGVLCHVMGIVRQGMKMQLLVLQYDEDFQQHVENAEAAGLCDTADMLESNRAMLRCEGNTDAANPFQRVSKVLIEEKEFEIHSSEHRRLGAQDWECILLLSEFLHQGWKPEGIDFQCIDMLFLTSLELEGDYTAIPAFDENPKLRFIQQLDSITYLVEQPITLVVDGKYQDKLRFKDAVSGEEHWALINRVYLSDMWAEMEKVFDNPKIREQMTPEQIAQAKSDFEERFLEICPKGMCLPIIEYECEEGISLQFYSKAYLDTPPIHRSSSMGFIVRPDRHTGILGLTLKANVIQEPFSPNTLSIEAELFQYNHATTGTEIILK